MSAPVGLTGGVYDDSFNAWQQDINQFVQRAGKQPHELPHVRRDFYRGGDSGGTADRCRAALVAQDDCSAALAIISNHFDSIAKGISARQVAVYGKTKFRRSLPSLKAMQKRIATGNGLRCKSQAACHAHRDLRDCGWQ
ncbi:hypothetical protein KIF59_05590 [Enterobacter cloacae subsp. cloacae]|nr:hypothetical protein [Enterobacter cloacae subsp. cloacae]